MSAQHDYLDGQLRDTHPALFECYAAASAAVTGGEIETPYGPHPRQTFDLFRASGTARGRIVYFHGGYWQSRGKGDFHFIVPGLLADGFDVALVNYPLCPEVSVAAITDSALAAMAKLASDQSTVLVGHSAGGQIVAEIALTRRCKLAGIVAISGVFDLEPLIETTLNDRLQLDAASARAVSPLHRVTANLPSAVFAVGGDETPAFQNQNRAMAEAWQAAGNDARQLSVTGADHFSILESLGDSAAPLGAAVRGFF